MSDNDNGSAVYNIVAFTFQGKDAAEQNLKDIKSSGALDGYDIVAQATVSQDEKGKVHVKEPGKGGKGAAIGGAIGGVLGIFGGPAGVLALGAAGAAIGGFAGHLDRYVPKEDLEELGDALSPNSSALLILLEDTYTEDAINSMGGYDAQVVTLTVGDDLSGEIAQYASGAVTDAAGDVVAGDAAVVTDADGDVAAASDVAAGTTS
jgi:uncharacterized membrane protein